MSRNRRFTPRTVAAPAAPLSLFVGLLFFVIALFAIAVSARAETIDVPGDYPTIQAAIDAAVDGDTALVQPGTYFENEIGLNKSIFVTGTAPEDSLVVANTVVDAIRFGRVFVLESDASPTIAGMTITRGYDMYVGGGIVLTDGMLTLRHSVIYDNSEGRGAGIYVSGSDLYIENCDVKQNVSNAFFVGDGGGGLCVTNAGSVTMSTCRFVANYSRNQGGGMMVAKNSQALVEDTLFRANDGTGVAGGMIVDNATAELERVRFEDNTAYYWAAGFESYASTVSLDVCVFRGNYLPYLYPGTGSFLITDAGTGNSATLRNCIVAGGVGDGGGVVGALTIATISNCVIEGNQGNGLKARFGAQANIINTIVRGNTGSSLVEEYDGLVNANYSNIQGGWDGEGNIDADPMFRSYRGFDYVLAPGSPCVDAGDPTIEDGVYDAHPRWPEWYPNGSRSDMGAYGGPDNEKWLSRN